MKKIGRLGLLIIICCLTFAACDYSYRKLREKRSRVNEAAKGDIVIGVVTSQSYVGLFAEGVRLAVDELNENDGIFGRKIRLIFKDDMGRVDLGQKIARSLVHDIDMTAVIGHIQSDVALAVSMIYEAGGLLFISPGATDPRLTRQKDSQYTFRNIPSDDIIIRKMAEYCQRQGFKRPLIIYDRTENTRRQAKMFAEAAKALSMEIVATRSYFRWQDDYQAMAADLNRNYKFDAVFLAGRLPSAGYVIEQMREMGCDAPFFAMPDLDSPELGGIIGRAAEGTVVPTVFDPKMLSKTTREFVNRFEKVYDVPPDTMAAQGYDALKVLAHAITKKGSTVPLVMASSLHFTTNWDGVTGTYSFTSNGDIIGKSIYFKKFVNGSFEYISRGNIAESVDPYYVIEDISLRLPIQRDPPTLDPGLAIGPEAEELAEQLFMGLTTIDPHSLSAVPALAESWEVSADGKSYKFHLRHGIQWTDQAPITAQDVVGAIERNRKPETRAPYIGLLRVIKHVEALDDYTVSFTLKQREVFFPSLLALNVFKPLPTQTLKKFGADWTTPANIVSNGPYRLHFWKKGKRLVLRKSPTYFQAGQVSIPELHYYVIPEPSVGLAMYQNNELDLVGGNFLGLPQHTLNEVKRNPTFSKTYSKWPKMSTQALIFNSQHPITGNRLVRKALASIIDRELITSLLTYAGNDPAHTFTPPQMVAAPYARPDIIIPFKPQTGQKWLAQAGYPQGLGFPELELYYLKSDDNSKLARAIRDLAAYYLNIKIKPVATDWANYIKLLKATKTVPMLLVNWPADYPDTNNSLNDLCTQQGVFNLPNWSDPKYITLMEQAQSTLSASQRQDIYTEAEKRLCAEQALVIPIYYGNAQVLMNPRVKDWQIMPFGGQHIMNWRLEN